MTESVFIHSLMYLMKELSYILFYELGVDSDYNETQIKSVYLLGLYMLVVSRMRCCSLEKEVKKRITEFTIIFLSCFS